jgi:type IV secretion system protein VirB2
MSCSRKSVRSKSQSSGASAPSRSAASALILLFVPLLAFAQASPFQTGADSLVTNALAIALPLGALVVMGIGVMAMVGRISWSVAIGSIAGIALVFGAPQIITWARGMFGV